MMWQPLISGYMQHINQLSLDLPVFDGRMLLVMPDSTVRIFRKHCVSQSGSFPLKSSLY